MRSPTSRVTLRAMPFPALARALACLALALSCSAARGPEPESATTPHSGTPPGPISAVRVELASGLEAPHGELARRVAAQTALDWLEHAGVFDPRASGRVYATITELRVRSATTTWLFPFLAPPDRMAVRVRFEGPPELGSSFEIAVESRVAGFRWRDRTMRAERLARRLGRRIAEKAGASPSGRTPR